MRVIGCQTRLAKASNIFGSRRGFLTVHRAYTLNTITPYLQQNIQTFSKTVCLCRDRRFASSVIMAETTNGTHSSTSSIASLANTKLIFHSAAHQATYELNTTVTSIVPLSDLSESDASVFKPATPPPAEAQIFALTTEATIFHPQGGGQPSDVGQFLVNDNPIFEVLTVRTAISKPGVVLHFGYFLDSSHAKPGPSSLSVTENVNSERRLLFSRLHTAGHALGASVRTLLESKIEGFDELKASHFPDSASCEFQGLIDGKYKGDIQKAVDELVAKDAEVRIGWWRKGDFRHRGLERLLPSDEVWQQIAIAVDDRGESESGSDDDEVTRIRVVEIVGAEVYPCGGTHVPSTKACGKVGVKKISRSKGQSRVSYFVD